MTHVGMRLPRKIDAVASPVIRGLYKWRHERVEEEEMRLGYVGGLMEGGQANIRGGDLV